MAAECKNSFWVFVCSVCVCAVSQSPITARVVVDAASVCPAGACPLPLDSLPNEVLNTHTPKQMFVKGHLPSSFCINISLLLGGSVLEHKTNNRHIPPTLNPQISLAVLPGLKCHTFKIIILKWIESAGLCPHEWTAETRWWGGMIMSLHGSQS